MCSPDDGRSEVIASLWWGIKSQLIGYLIKRGCDFHMAEDIVSEVYIIMVKQLPDNLSPAMSYTYARTCASRLWYKEAMQRKHFARSVQDDDGAWHSMTEFLPDMSEANAHATSVVVEGGQWLHMYGVLMDGVTPEYDMQPWVTPTDHGPGKCQVCGDSAEARRRYCIPCSVKQDRAKHREQAQRARDRKKNKQ